jgi:hypothetical protein
MRLGALPPAHWAMPKDAAAHGVHLAVVTLPAARHGFVMLPRRPARDDERLPITLAGCHCLVFAILLLRRVAELMAQSA